MDEQLKAHVAAVRVHARKHYNEEGWDYVVESFDDAEIANEIAFSPTPEAAIKRMRKLVRLLNERREDIQGEAW